MKLFENVVNYKINHITKEELLKYSKQYQIPMNEDQAKKVVSFLRGKNYNVFDPKQREQLVREIAKIVGPETARKVNELFLQFINQ
ncbi:DUF2624 domain-containing protein [Aeribacillus pallidus]|jgi:TRAP-type C4-dicarboxylate transport system substrate-binding protein|uniref:DUF2624 domain-containing protein n=1 Tax=Aeribacillus pallidus TaxID=33936 RepID=UPI001D421B7D|nr:DUF2624 domain-containing protein [Bacillus sp. (in: firmicutes)]